MSSQICPHMIKTNGPSYISPVCSMFQDAAHIPVSIMKFNDKNFTRFVKFQFQGLFMGYQHLTPLKAALI